MCKNVRIIERIFGMGIEILQITANDYSGKVQDNQMFNLRFFAICISNIITSYELRVMTDFV